jgi:hypothetical protein
VQVPTGTDVVWGAESAYESVLARDAPDGVLTLHNVVLAPGKYVVATTLLGAALCPEGFQPSSVDGSVSGGQIGWRCVYMPTTDAATCPIIPDDSRERYFKGVQDAWAAAAATKGAAAAAAAAAAAPAAGKGGGKGAPAGAGRKEAAAAALARYLEQPQEAAAAAAAGGAATSGSSAVVRTLGDGSSLALSPDDAVVVVRPGAGGAGAGAGEAAVVLSVEARSARLATSGAAEGSSESVPTSGGLAGSLEQGKASRAALAARRQSEFSEWRSGGQVALKGAAKARADAVRTSGTGGTDEDLLPASVPVA